MNPTRKRFDAYLPETEFLEYQPVIRAYGALTYTTTATDKIIYPELRVINLKVKRV